MKADSKVISQLNESSSTIHKTVEREMNYIEVCGHYHFLSTKDVLNDETARVRRPGVFEDK